MTQNNTPQINPILKIVLELGPLVVYFWAFKKFSDTPLQLFGEDYFGLVAAMLVFIPATVIAMAVTYALTRQISKMQIFILVLTLVIGGLTAYLNDDKFVKLRPTVVNALFGIILGFGIWVQKKSYLQYLIGDVMPLSDQGWFKFTRNFAIYFFIVALINEVIRNFMSDGIFAFWDTFGQMGLGFAFLATQYPMLSQHFIEPEEETSK